MLSLTSKRRFWSKKKILVFPSFSFVASDYNSRCHVLCFRKYDPQLINGLTEDFLSQIDLDMSHGNCKELSTSSSIRSLGIMRRCHGKRKCRQTNKLKYIAETLQCNSATHIMRFSSTSFASRGKRQRDPHKGGLNKTRFELIGFSKLVRRDWSDCFNMKRLYHLGFH